MDGPVNKSCKPENFYLLDILVGDLVKRKTGLSYLFLIWIWRIAFSIFLHSNIEITKISQIKVFKNFPVSRQSFNEELLEFSLAEILYIIFTLVAWPIFLLMSFLSSSYKFHYKIQVFTRVFFSISQFPELFSYKGECFFFRNKFVSYNYLEVTPSSFLIFKLIADGFIIFHVSPQSP